MQEEGPKTSDTEVQKKQTVCKKENKEKSNTTKLERFKNNPKVKTLINWPKWPILALPATMVFITIIILNMPHFFVKTAMSMYNNNSTEAEMHISLANNFLLSAITSIYVLLTWNLAMQSKQAIEQSRKEQKIRDIENRLEKFYMPAQSTLKVAVEYLKDPFNVNKWTTEVYSYKRAEHHNGTSCEEYANAYVAEKLKEIEKHRFLAKGKTCRSLINFLCEEESTENRLEFSNCVQEDIEYYLVKLHELKKDN
jgi:hypothetical protein